MCCESVDAFYLPTVSRQSRESDKAKGNKNQYDEIGYNWKILFASNTINFGFDAA